MARKRTYSGPKQKKEPEVAANKELGRHTNASRKTAGRGSTLGMFGHGMKRVAPKGGR